MVSTCLFCRIAAKEIPSQIVFEDSEFLAFKDVNPQAPVHILIIPKSHYNTLLDVSAFTMLGRAQQIIIRIAEEQGIAQSGFRIVMNCRDDGGQTVYHLHYHLLGGRFMAWPPG